MELVSIREVSKSSQLHGERADSDNNINGHADSNHHCYTTNYAAVPSALIRADRPRPVRAGITILRYRARAPRFL